MPKAASLKAVPPDHAVVLVFLRTGQGWSQAQLCRVAGISPTQLNDYESGRKALTRERLDQLAGALGLPPERVDETLACLAANRAAAAPPEANLDARAATRRKIEVLAARAGRMQKDHARELLSFLTDEGEALVARQQAGQQMIRLQRRTAGQRRFLVETVAEFRNWALAEAAALESVRLAPNHPREAREWAELAVSIAELAPGEETRRRRLHGWTLHFLANALRTCNDLPAAEKARARGRKLWEAGAPGDPGLLAEAWLPWIEANLRMDQRRLPEALKRIDEALALDQGELRAQILMSKSNILRRLEDPAGSTAVLLEAEPLIDARREPRLAFGLRFNLLVDLCVLGKAAEAEPRLPAVWRLAKRLGEPLDLTRCLWLQGQVHSALGRVEEALAAFRQVRRTFHERPLAYDYALVSLDLSLGLLERGRTAEVMTIAEEMLWIFKAQEVHREALAALRVFCQAAAREAATVEETRKIARFLRRAQLDPELRFEEEGAEAE
jgi:transcriptional regulator with XRE-family HTH domain